MFPVLLFVAARKVCKFACLKADMRCVVWHRLKGHLPHTACVPCMIQRRVDTLAAV